MMPPPPTPSKAKCPLRSNSKENNFNIKNQKCTHNIFSSLNTYYYYCSMIDPPLPNLDTIQQFNKSGIDLAMWPSCLQ